MFTLDKVYKSYGSSTALQETTLKIDDGEFLSSSAQAAAARQHFSNC